MIKEDRIIRNIRNLRFEQIPTQQLSAKEPVYTKPHAEIEKVKVVHLD
jgi:hypothetical protein